MSVKMNKSLQEGQIVMCTVTKIAGTIVFVKIEDYDLEGTITFSEISPGRIRNIRDYAFPGKKIVCKVLNTRSGAIHLSLRRVKLKEKNELNESVKKERSFKALLKTVIKNKGKAEKIVEKIKNTEESLVDFLEEAKENSKFLEKYIPKESVEKIAKILREKKSKETTLGKKFSLSCKNSDGILVIKDVIAQAIKDGKCKSCDITYISAGNYIIKTKTKDPKQGDQQIENFIEKLSELAKKQNCLFNVKKS